MKHNISFELELKKHNFSGKLIAIEGNEGSGKTTQANAVVSELNKQGINAIYTKEPTDGSIGQLIRKVLSGDLKVPPVSLQYLFCADRAVHQEEIEEYLKKGYIVVTDRYFWSAAAYGIADLAGEEDFYLVSFSILSFYNRFLSPDVTIFLDVSIEEALKRISNSPKHNEIYDKKGMIEKVRQTYQKLIEKFPEEFVVINADRSKEEVMNDIISKVTVDKTNIIV